MDRTRRDLQAFAAGCHPRMFDLLGAHPRVRNGVAGVEFSVWAPNAAAVSVVGAFNSWDGEANPMRRIGRSGVWTAFVAGVEIGAAYKYRIEPSGGGAPLLKADPYAYYHEGSPGNTSIVWSLDYEWGDAEWMAVRKRRGAGRRPMSIYECHLGSWRRRDDRPLSYRETADALIEHLTRTGFTHVELLPPMEHPYYASWGYQVTGYFAPTSRYGTPQDLMFLVDRLHQAGFGVIFDWVPSHFPADDHGPGRFDGSRLYEYPDPRLGYHPDWKSYVFNYGRNEVRSFLVSSAMFWVEKFHVDALRVDGVASMLYLDYSRADGEWIANKHGGRENLEAISFLRTLNDTLHEHHPEVLTIAEESTAWPMVSRPTYVGGLGFDMKWDMGWMHDTLRYMGLDPIHRKYNHEALTFRSVYAFSESFVLPLSHDEVVHGKASLIGKMHGDEWQRFAGLRLLYGWMWGLPGKKMLFMGGEIGQWAEWNHDRELHWNLLEYPYHAGVERWVADLNRVYREEPALHELDFHPTGFAWTDCSDADQSVVAFERRSSRRRNRDVVIAAFNFTPVPRHNYRIGVPEDGTYRELLNSDAECYAGSGIGNYGVVESVPMRYHSRPWSVLLSLPPLSAVFLKRVVPEHEKEDD